MSQQPSVLLYGDFTWDRLAASYERAFTALGCRVIPFDTRHLAKYLAPWLLNRIGHRLTINQLTLRRIGSQKWNRHLSQTALQEKPDLFFLINGDFIMPETLRALQQNGIKVFIFHADNPFPPFSNTRPETLPCARQSDCYFIWSQQLCERLTASDVKKVVYLPFAWDPHVFPYQEPDGTYDHELVFIGGWDKEREQILTPLAEQFDLKIWGPDYWLHRTATNSPLKKCWQGKAVAGHEASTILRRSKIALNIIRQQNLPDGVNMRTFELPGCGTFPLSTWTKGAANIFLEDKQSGYYHSLKDCANKVTTFLKAPQLRLNIITEAQKVVTGNHRYLDRASLLLQTYYQLI